ncbi:MraY family glycosyltransferase [Zwartia vadi]|uniref:MraY family glycosyltransferase n=1 Tax=Zwartia vadi TaxID=3058168 RepID=UPI0025B497B8|nr:glycosyltransferase family 4 protein [Zwartia vadi]MDN3987414.1 glycosyltransferase family 4 protein [Zwartia vadi]
MMAQAVLMVLSGFLAWYVARWVNRNAERLHLVQAPNHRSSHIRPTPSGGGLGILVAASLAGFAWVMISDWWVGLFALGLALILSIAGLCDDVRPLSARLRFSVQLGVCIAMLLVIGDFPSISLFPVINVELRGWFLLSLLTLVGVWWINLFNFMDGIDGLAASQAICMLLAAAALSLYTYPESLLTPVWGFILCVAAATCGFLLLNWAPAKIFMGDAGSTWLAFMVFVLALLSVQAGWLNYACWLVLAAVFVTDATMTLVTRMLRGERWHEAHRSHAYQRLSRKWTLDTKSGHRSVTLLVIGVNMLWLLPLAAATLALSSYNWLWITLAYTPLIISTWRLGAGKPDNA